MKKFIASVSIMLAAVAQAEFMMWSVDTSYLPTGEKAITGAAYMRVGYTAKGSAPHWSGQYLTVYDLGGTSQGTVNIDYDVDMEYKVDLTDVKSGDYVYYIELLNDKYQIIGRTQGTEPSTTYAQLESGNYVATGSISEVPEINVWHGGAAFEAVPEPSSMALLALGAGLVGLRRKLKKGKKEKRA